MATRKPDVWMWAQMRAMMNEADEMRGRFFELRKGKATPTWEPPVDVIETATELLVLVALPGVDPNTAEAVIQNGELVVGGTRRLPDSLRNCPHPPHGAALWPLRAADPAAARPLRRGEARGG